jgi:hypothetical protein
MTNGTMRQQRMTRAPDAMSRWTLTGTVLLLTYAVLAIGDWRWSWLAGWQDIELYKQLTGGALVMLIVAQWRLTVARIEGTPRTANRLLIAHRYWGALAPLLLYLHADEFGHAYIRVMCLSFLGLISLGLLHQPLNRLNRPWVMTTWLVTHVALATMLIALIGYHAFNSFYYE